MIVSLTIEGIRGQDATYEFKRLNLLKGRNGSGKSTIKEAICLAFAGTDSSGSKSPTHLISRGATGLRLVLRTGKAEITRTLTQKGSQSLSLALGDARTPLSQAELTQKLGASPDAFLSVLLPGYFLRLPQNRQQGVLAEVMPPIDRKLLIEELIQGSVTEGEWTLIDTSKRADLAGTKLTAARRQMQGELDRARGRLTVFADAARALPPAPPARPDLAETVAGTARLREAWRDYAHRKAAYDKVRLERMQLEQTNTQRSGELAALQSELAALVVPAPRVVLNPGVEIRALEGSKKLRFPLREENVVSTERCPTCGQVVGSKHREHVVSENAKTRKDTEAKNAEVDIFNSDVQKKIDELSDRYQREHAELCADLKSIQQLTARRSQLEARCSALGPRSLPEVPPEPTAPAEEYDEQKENQIRREYDEHLAALNRHSVLKEQYDRAVAESAKLEREVASIGGAVARAELLEDALRRLPQEELARQSAALAMSGYRLDVGERIELFRSDGAPYQVLSTGERIRADVNLSLKFNSLLKRPVGVIYLDDADLVDDLPQLMDLPGVQLFVAQVVTDKSTLELSAYD